MYAPIPLHNINKMNNVIKKYFALLLFFYVVSLTHRSYTHTHTHAHTYTTREMTVIVMEIATSTKMSRTFYYIKEFLKAYEFPGNQQKMGFQNKFCENDSSHSIFWEGVDSKKIVI